MFLGLADHFVPSESLPALAEALESSTAEAAVGRFAQEPPASALSGQRKWIDDAYASDDAEEIVARLRNAGGKPLQPPRRSGQSRLQP
ncbi:enoyl-Coa hydratase [Arthrobacter sp. Hiyo8]|nr:enoyl-Coa hydratase [Arthrobacter sp. Hiyo8]